MGNFLIGSYRARLDKSGRLKIPEKFRLALEEKYGKDVVITSLKGESVQVYPLPVWQKIADITTEGTLPLKPAVKEFHLHMNRFGNHYEIDSKGRVLISPDLRERAKLNEEVEVIGLSNYLEIWDKDILDKKLEERPLTDEDFEVISELKPKGKPE